MPGVVVTTATRSGPSSDLRARSGQYFVAGIAERGSDTAPVLLRSMTDYYRLFGNRVSYGFLHDDLQMFFEEGGSQAWVARVVGPAATAGNVMLIDTAAVTPQPTLQIDAANPGAWSADLEIEVTPGTNPDTYRIQVYLAGELTESYNNLSTPTDAVARLAKSALVRATDLGSTTAAPGNNPAVAAPMALSAGVDDRVSVTASTYTEALSRFDVSLGDGAVAIPGMGVSVHSGLVEHAKANMRIALLTAARGETVTNLTVDIAANIDSEFAGLFAPFVLTPDGTGGTRAISPEGYVAACRNRAHEEAGPWRAPAGEIATARFVVGLDESYNRDTGDALDAARVNAIRLIGNTVRLYGWRSLSRDESNYALLTGRDVLNYVVNQAESVLEHYVFQTIDGKGRLLAQVAGEIVGIAEPMRQAGGLYERLDATGAVLDPGYSVDTGNSVNTAETLANNEIRARLALRVSPVGALVNLTIVKVGFTASV